MQGRVICSTNDKTISVEVTHLAPHPKYKRRVRKKKKYQAHDPLDQFQVGDFVQLEKTAPIRKTKIFLVVPVPPRNQPKPKEEENQEFGLRLNLLCSRVKSESFLRHFPKSCTIHFAKEGEKGNPVVGAVPLQRGNALLYAPEILVEIHHCFLFVKINQRLTMEKYEKLEKVGEGTYDKVYKAKDKATRQLVALKKTRLEMDEEGKTRLETRVLGYKNDPLIWHPCHVHVDAK